MTALMDLCRNRILRVLFATLSLLPLFIPSSRICAKETAREFLWNQDDEDVILYRWRLADGPWTESEPNDINPTDKTKNKDSFHVQASYDGIHWSEDSILILLDSEEGIAFFWDSSAEHQKWCLDDGVWFDATSDGGSWKTDDIPLSSLDLTQRHSLKLKSSFDGENWNNPTTFHLMLRTLPREEECHWTLGTGLSYSKGIYDFYNGHETKGPRVFTISDYGFTSSLELNRKLLRHLDCYFETAGSYERKKTEDIIYPQGFSLYYGKAGFGLDYLYPSVPEGDLAFLCGVSGGFLMHLYSYERQTGGGIILLYSPSAYLGARIGLRWNLGDHFDMGIFSKVTISHLWDEDVYMRSFTYLVEPFGISLGVKF